MIFGWLHVAAGNGNEAGQLGSLRGWLHLPFFLVFDDLQMQMFEGKKNCASKIVL